EPDAGDCGDGWVCGLEGACHDRGAGAYLCTDDSFCAGGWRCAYDGRCADPSTTALRMPSVPLRIERLSPADPRAFEQVEAAPRYSGIGPAGEARLVQSYARVLAGQVELLTFLLPTPDAGPVLTINRAPVGDAGVR